MSKVEGNHLGRRTTRIHKLSGEVPVGCVLLMRVYSSTRTAQTIWLLNLQRRSKYICLGAEQNRTDKLTEEVSDL